MVGSVDDLIGERADTRHRLTLGPDRSEQSLAFLGRMRPACFAETILKNVVGSFEEKNNDVQTGSTQCFELFFEIGKKPAFANVDNERGARDPFLVIIAGNEPAESRQHRDGQVVDAEVSEVLKSVSGR